MHIEVFGKQDCALCESTKRKILHFIRKWGHAGRVDFAFVDMDTVDGLAEGAFRDVNEIPTTIVSDDGKAFGRWEGAVPPSEEVREALSKCLLKR
ncbi:MAG: YbbN family protein [Planctomycetota bacterium]|jgi:thioredoxin-like negative regulator of GroEL